MKKFKCGNCNVSEGQYHEFDCTRERCPFCGGQMISCGCRYRLTYPTYDTSDKYCGLPKEVYEHGLPDKQWTEWVDLLAEKGRVPFIFYPNVCGKCGLVDPDLFQVSNEDWEHYIQKDSRELVICRKCYNSIKRMVQRIEKCQ